MLASTASRLGDDCRFLGHLCSAVCFHVHSYSTWRSLAFLDSMAAAPPCHQPLGDQFVFSDLLWDLQMRPPQPAIWNKKGRPSLPVCCPLAQGSLSKIPTPMLNQRWVIGINKKWNETKKTKQHAIKSHQWITACNKPKSQKPRYDSLQNCILYYDKRLVMHECDSTVAITTMTVTEKFLKRKNASSNLGPG